MPIDIRRRDVLLASLGLPLVQGCAGPMQPVAGGVSSPDGRALLDDSAAAHGKAALPAIGDLNISYAGEWRRIVPRLQPALVDAGYRGRSEERLLLRDRLTAQAHEGPSGRKQVVRQGGVRGQGEVQVWYDGLPSSDADRRAGAALVADAYSLFLLGPLVVAGPWAGDRDLIMERAGAERIEVSRQQHHCDILRVQMTPGLGLSRSDRIELFIDRADRLMRRVRFSLDGMDGTRGAIAEVDAFDHVSMHGVRWPTGFYERLLRPAPLPVHDWRLTGLDVNRGLTDADVTGARFSARAATPATPLQTLRNTA